MWQEITRIFNRKNQNLETEYLQKNQIMFDQQQGYIVDGIVVNQWSERLMYFSNRRMSKFDDLKALYLNAILINEKIDLEIASQRYVQRLGNNQENLLQMQQSIQKLNDYYRQFLRDR